MKKLKKVLNPKKLVRLFRRQSRKVKVAAVVLALLIAGQAYFDVWIYQSHHDEHAVLRQSEDNRLVMMITSAIKDVNKPAVVNPTNKRVYLPDASLVLPPYPGHVTEVLYEYSGGDNEPRTMQITTQDAVQSGVAKVLATQPSENMAAVFSQVPNAQACARGLTVTLNKGPAEHQDADLVFTKMLHDGRQLNVYQPNTCAGYDFTPLVDYLKDAKSY